MSMPEVAAVTLVGKKHLGRGVPCEDYSLATKKNGVSVVVVADGAGSKQYTHARFGSKAACEVISDLFIDHFDAIYSENREAAVRSLIITAVHIKFADLLKEHQLDSLERLSCTLLFCAVKDRRMIIGHIGDGLIARVTPSGLSPITMPQNGANNASSTYFVTVPHAADYLRIIKTTTDDCHAVALMTDGVQDNVYDETSGLVKPVVVRMCNTLFDGREACEKQIKEILEKYIVGSSNNSDDASFGIIYFNGTDTPDTDSLPKQAVPFPRNEETFKDLQTLMLADAKKAKSIIVDAKANAPLDGDKSGVVKSGENESAAEHTSEKMEDINVAAKKTGKIVLALAIVEFLAILALLVKIFWLK
ncbi:MAG: protein phosphatase 2C domain-containing protein [Clostridiales bacterium]|nr:protein phosphatase 2C domain-containing protein [Clostridiales bacterium]